MTPDQLQEKRLERNAYQRKYYNANKEKFKEYARVYYERTKDDLSIYNKERVTCECGVVLARASIRAHLRSRYHDDVVNGRRGNH